ncbi:MAG: hypothetical protein ABI542_04675 [Gemmatimonadota bacterium]
MRNTTRWTKFVLFGLLLGTAACAVLQQAAALTRVSFALEGVRAGRLAGVDISRLTSYRDITPTDAARLALNIARGTLPLEFTLPVSAHNPSGNGVAASMVRFGWTLDLDGREALRGSLDSLITIPAGGTVEIPLTMRVDLVEFVGGSAESLARIALATAGANADPTMVRLRATPVIDTPIGPISYPEPITIVSRSVGNRSP